MMEPAVGLNDDGNGDGDAHVPDKPRRNGRTVNLLAKSVPSSHLFNFKIPFYVRQKREEQRARQLLTAKQALTQENAEGTGGSSIEELLRRHPVGAGLPQDEPSPPDARAELRHRLHHNHVVRVATSVSSSSPEEQPASGDDTSSLSHTQTRKRRRSRREERRQKEKKQAEETRSLRGGGAAMQNRPSRRPKPETRVHCEVSSMAERALGYAHLCGRFAQVFATHVWPFKPLHPASWDDTIVRMVLEKGTIVAGEDEWHSDGDDGAMKDNRVLAFTVFTALSLGAQACGATEAALALYEQARAHLSLLFDTCDIHVAETLIALQYLLFLLGMKRVIAKGATHKALWQVSCFWVWGP